MAPKKVVSKPTSMIPFEEQMAQYAEKAIAVTGSGGGSFISLKGGIIQIDGSPVPGNTMEAVVVAHLFENAWRPDKYEPDNPQPPKCYAFGEDQDTMAPHEDSSEPQGVMDPDTEATRDKDGKILGTCADCWANQWGSAETGRGKACKNQRRLALIAGDEESLKDVDNEKLEFLRTPVMSSGAWDDYVKDIGVNLRRPPFAVVTTITTAPDPKSQFRVVFKLNSKIDDAGVFEQLRLKHEAALVKLPFPYQAPSEEAPAPASKSNKFAGRGKTAAAKAPAKSARGARR